MEAGVFVRYRGTAAAGAEKEAWERAGKRLGGATRDKRDKSQALETLP